MPRLYDFPDATQHSPRREVATTPLQQLFVLNSEWMQHQAARLALRVSDIGDPASRVRALYRFALGRDPKPGETGLAQSLLDRRRAELGRYPWEEYAQVLLGTNKFIFFN